MLPPRLRALLALICVLAATLGNASAYVLHGYSWPAGPNVFMHLGLGGPPPNFSDGSSSWNDSATDALAIWNQHLNTIRLVAAGGITNSGGDGANSVFFSSTIYGESFGSNALAVTIQFSPQGNTFTETEVIFNSAKRWGSYRGPVQTQAGGPVFDFHRVALHEFGHVLGLDHPDEHGQPGQYALMNSHIGDLDSITEDDIAGARQLYGSGTGGGGGETLGKLLATLPVEAAQLTTDRRRPRVYATEPKTNSVVIIDSDSLAVIKRVPVGVNPFGLAVSANGSKLWVANRGSSTPAISAIDLDRLEPSPGFNAPVPAYDVEEGLDGRLYASAFLYSLIQIDTTTGAAQFPVSGFLDVPTGFLEMSPDRRTLFHATISNDTLSKCDVSTPTARLLQSRRVGGISEDLALTRDGSFVVVGGGSGNPGDPRFSSAKLQAADINVANGSFQIGSFPGPVVFSGDGAVFYHAATSPGRVSVFDAQTFASTGTITASETQSAYGPDASDIALDNTGRVLFFAATPSATAGELRVYATGRLDVQPLVAPRPKTLKNVSTRVRAQLGDNVAIGGFTIEGSGAKKVVVRAIGPSLPVGGPLADPVLTLHAADGQVITSNDNWKAHQLQLQSLQLPPSNEREAAIVATLQPGAYTAIVRGLNDTTGVALVEVFDVDPQSASRIKNLSTRGRVETGDNVMIGGFVIAGDQPTRVLIRAVGPSLALDGVAAVLEDPTLDLFDTSGTAFASNDDWVTDQEIATTGLPPRDGREAAIVRTLPPGAYTAIVRGKNGTSGVALVELYNLEP